MKHSGAKIYKRLAGVLTAALTAAVIAASALMPVGAEDASDKKIAVDPTGKGDGFSTVLYNNPNGLPTSEANAIVQTDEGFIWIGSYSGLIRYDGRSFERIRGGTNIASVVSLFADSKDRLWIGSNDSGVTVMENGKFTQYGKPEGLRALSVRSITEDNSGNIYVATTEGVAVIGEDMQLHMADDPKINEEYIRDIFPDSQGTVYGVTMSGSVFTIKGTNLTGFYDADALGISGVRTIRPDPVKPGFIYIGTSGSELYYGELAKGFGGVTPTDISPLGFVNSIYLVDNMTWLCTDTGIGFVVDGRFTQVTNIPMTSSVEKVMTDYQGNLWFCSSQQGVMKIVPNQFSDIYDKYDLTSEVVYTTCILDDKMFIGTKSSGLVVLKEGQVQDSLPLTAASTASGKELESTDLIEMLSGSRIRSIVKDSMGRLWFSTFGENGLVRYDHGKVVTFTPDDGMPSDRTRAVFECKDGTVIAACTGGLAVISGDKVTRVYSEADGLYNTEILTAVEADNGDYIVGTDGGGIYIINAGGITSLRTSDGLSSDVIMRVKRDRNRELYWLVTSNSLSYLTPDYKIITVDNFPYSNNFDVYQNSRDEMWVLSSNGVYVAPAEQVIDNKDISALFYGRDNGLPGITTSNSYSALTKGGDLYIATTSGITKVNIEVPFENVSNIKAAVPFLEADGEYIYPDKDGTFRISSDVEKLTVYSFVYNYSLINPDVTYRLNGFERNSTTLKRSELDPITYTNLKGGEYTFELKIQDSHGQSSRELSFKIIKEQKFFEMVWVRIVLIVLAAALISFGVSFYIRIRTDRFLKKEAEQKLLIREIVEAFAKVIDMKDKYTNGHSTRVAEYTAMLTRELDYDDETVEKYYNIALLHDIGKIGVPKEVLNKEGPLDDDEFNTIKSHSGLGYNVLKDIHIMPELAIGAGAHHERPDGKGYPKGLKGDEIPRVAQIIAVADTFDAMYSDRPYRKRMNFDRAVSIIKEVRGTQLTSDVVDAFLRLVDKGEFRAPDDTGGGTTEDIDNIHKRQKRKEQQNAAKKANKEGTPPKQENT
ncbi:MAG: HD domain-containing protein [Ruminococcus sp.]|nr:HD domain-containing protein [Ruminococcus sp.]